MLFPEEHFFNESESYMITYIELKNIYLRYQTLNFN